MSGPEQSCVGGWHGPDTTGRFMFCRERQQPGDRDHLGMMLRSVEPELIKAAASTLCGTVLDAVLRWWMTARPSGGRHANPGRLRGRPGRREGPPGAPPSSAPPTSSARAYCSSTPPAPLPRWARPSTRVHRRGRRPSGGWPHLTLNAQGPGHHHGDRGPALTAPRDHSGFVRSTVPTFAATMSLSFPFWISASRTPMSPVLDLPGPNRSAVTPVCPR